MGDVYQLGTSTDSHARLLEKWITETIAQHPNEAVAARWSEMARLTARKFPGPPVPSQSEIDLDGLVSLTSSDKEKVIVELEKFIGNYFNDVRRQLMQVHGELLTLQKKIAELEQPSNS